MKDDVVAWNLPAGLTCPFKGDCYLPCYALQGQYRINDPLRQKLQENYRASLRDDFAFRMVGEIVAQIDPSQNLIRVHDSGDFYSQRYVEDWATILERCSKHFFYAYTKAFHGLDLSKLTSRSNFRLIQSVGGIHDAHLDVTKPHARIFQTVQDLEAAGYVDASHSDLPAIRGETRIGLVIHGQGKRFFKREKHGERLPPSGPLV